MHGFSCKSVSMVPLFLALISSLASPAAAQEQEEQERIVDPPYWTQKGDELPTYYCVGAFFDYAFDLYSTSEGTFANLLEDLRIEPGSEATRVLRKHMFLGQALREERMPLRPLMDDRERLMQAKRDWLRRQVADWKALWKGFRAEYEESGGDLDTLDVYIDRDIRPTITVWSTGPAEET